MNLPFENIQLLWLLLLLPIIVLVYFYALAQKKKVAKKIGDAVLVNELTANYNQKSYPKKFLLIFISMMLVLLALANLRKKTGSEKITRNGIDIMIALDVSKSMLAKDVQPNRLERAKQLLGKLIDRLSNDRIGIIVFAGKSYLQMPLTGDHTATKMYLSAATPETVPTQGTVIGDALKMSYAAFNTKEKKYKAVILISDGEDHDENAVDIATEMASQGVVINTVGIGSTEGTTIFDELTNDAKKDKEGNTVITKLNEQILADIAASGKGTYQLFTNTDEVVDKLYSSLSSMEKRNVEDNSLASYKSWFQILLGLAFLLLVIEILINEVKINKVKNLKYIATTFLLFFSINIFAQAQKEAIKNGNEAYKKNDFETAIKQYQQATTKNDKNTKAQFNLGNALYKADKKDDAINTYDKAAKDAVKPAEKSNALYNKAVALQNTKKLKESIDAYKKALMQDGNNEDARHNLQLALRQQKQEEQKEKEQKEKEKQQDKQNQDKNKKEDKEPKPQQSNISKKDAEQKLNALQQKEKELQDKLHKVGAANANKQDKDW